MGKRKIGIYGGSFDPIHFGHINLAVQLKEKGGLDEVIFCPTYLSPFKKNSPPKEDGKKRLAMVQIIIEEIPGFSVSDCEVNRKKISYTIDTLRQKKKEYETKNISLNLLIAEDSLPYFHSWKEVLEIIEIAPPIIGGRTGQYKNCLHLFSKEIAEKLNKNFIETKKLDISSTEIKDRLKKGLYCGHLVPAKVLDYIYSHHLYYSSVCN